MFTALIGFAALSFSIGGYFMKLSDGFTHFRPTMLVFACFAVGTSLQIVAMRTEQMSITYMVGLGFEAITAFSLSVLLLKESTSMTKLAGIGLVLAGTALLRMGSP